MKRSLIGLCILAITLSFSYLTVLTLQYKMRFFDVEVINSQKAEQVRDIRTKESDFVPEFSGLPNFNDIDNALPKGKLIDILDDGIYRRSDVVAGSGEKWLVLFEQNGIYSLKASTASVKNLKSISWPGDEKDARLTFSGAGSRTIAVKDIPGLTPGKVITLSHNPLWKELSDGELQDIEMDDDFKREFDLNDVKYILRVSKGLTKDGTQVAVLVLESNGVSQIIKQTYHVPSNDSDIVGSLLWAGDMDGDGKLDLYFDEFNEKGLTATELHLSTLAKSGELVKLAASFWMPGC